MNDNLLIRVENLKKYYNGEDVKALDGVTCDIKKGEMLKNHAHFLTVNVDVGLFIGDVDVFKKDFAFGWHFEQVQGA